MPSTERTLSWRVVGRVALRLFWVLLGIPLALFGFVLLIVLMFPIGGGTGHLLFAYSPGGSLGGARILLVGELIAAVLVTGLFRFVRYPLPWYGVAGLVGLVASWDWLRPALSDAAGCPGAPLRAA